MGKERNVETKYRTGLKLRYLFGLNCLGLDRYRRNKTKTNLDSYNFGIGTYLNMCKREAPVHGDHGDPSELLLLLHSHPVPPPVNKKTSISHSNTSSSGLQIQRSLAKSKELGRNYNFYY